MTESNQSQPLSGRDNLPIPNEPYAGPVFYDANDPATVYPPIQEVRPPKGAPNVLVVLIDDVGFGASSAFGGPINTPTAERLAANGLKYTRFHTCAICSATRSALLTGRNHHSVGMGAITEVATAAPGYTSMIPNTKASVAKTLRNNGYSTAQFGKCHEVPVWETSPMGPFDHWPTMQGMEKFYGFIGGETNQWFPEVFDGLARVEVPSDPSYHFTEDMANKAIDWIKAQKAIYPDKPFFLYWAPGATHAPHQVPQEWIEKYKGQFDDGWDALRERTFARQKELGVIPARCRADPAPGADPGLGRHAGGAAAGAAPPDGDLRRLPRAHRSRGRPHCRCAGGRRDPRQHPHLLHHRGQRRLGRRDPSGHLQRDDQLQRRRRTRDPGVLALPPGRLGWARLLCPLRRRLGARPGHALPVDQAGGLPLGRHPQRHDRLTGRPASRPRARCATSSTTSSTSRRPFSKPPDLPEPTFVEGVQQSPMEGTSMLYSFNDGARRTGIPPNTSSLAATAASTRTGGRR